MKHNNIFGDFIKRTAVLLSALFVIAATAWAQNEPRVGIELCEAGPDYIHVKGWAVDPDYKDYSIDVAVSIYTDQNCTQSSGSSVYKANKETPDVSVIQSIPGKHGFEFNFPIDAGNYWLKFVVNNKNNTNSTILGPYPVTVTAPLTGTVTLTPQSGIITLGNGATLTGTGGENTYVTIAAGATVTFSDVNIANYNRHEEGELPSFIKCQGDATIILAKGTTNTIIGGQYLTPGIQVGPQNTTLTIKGYGTLVLRSWGFGSCIGARPKQACGNIVIEGGTFDLRTELKYQEQTLSAYAACIGSSGNGSSCGDITISGGNIKAWSSFGGAAIGSGRDGTCGDITITGGTIYTKSEYSLGGSAIGGGLNGVCGNISISGVTSVTAQIDPYTYPYCIGPGGGSGTCGTLTLWGQISDYIVGKLLVDIKLAPTDVPYTVSFNANGGTGSMSDQSFYSNTPQALTANGFSLSGKAFKCWSTEADGSGYDFYNGESVTNLGNVTLYAQWAKTDYVVSFDANGGIGTMAGQNFLWDMTQVLNANTFVYPGFAFVEWNTMQDGSGTSYTDKQAVSNLGNVTLYAQWTPTTYTITYVDAVNGTDGVTNTNPTNYAYMDNAITLAEPTRMGFVFDGWTYEGQDTPTKSVTIAQGTYGDLTFTAHWTEIDILTLTPQIGAYTVGNGKTLTGTGGPDTHITIADGATVTLSDVIINDITDDMHHKWSGITCEGDATIILADGTINNLKGGYWSFPGISVPENKTLTIQGSGTLYSSSNGNGPGIGTDGYSGGDGNIIIAGGTIIATGSKKNPGIGGIYRSYSGNITITDGVTSVTATAGAEAPYSIGSGSGTVTIDGVVTGNFLQSIFTYNPSDRTPYTVTFDANGGEGSMDVQEFVSNTPKALTANVFTRTNHVFDGWNTKADGTGTNYSDGQTVINLGNVTLYARWWSTDVTRITTDTKEIELVDGDKIGGTGGTMTHVTIADGATVTLSGVDITKITNSSSYQWAGISCAGDATIILSGENTVKGGYRSAGIFVPEGRTLTIKGNGSLTATGQMYAAGIGSGDKGSCGDIVIEGGNITATGGSHAAGIGCGNKGSCGNIVIEGGTIMATGGLYAPGIGSGYDSSSAPSSCGDITIARTVTSVTATKGNNALHSIGEGSKYSICGMVTIGGATGPISESTYIYNPNGSLESTIHFDKNNDNATGTMDDWHFTWDGQEHAIPACTFTGPEGTIMRWNTKADGSGIYYTNGQNVIDILSGTLYAIWRDPTESVPNGELTLNNGLILTGTGGTMTHVTIADGATVTLSGVDITKITNSSSYKWAGITCLGDATIILSGENTVKGGYRSAGITVPEGHTLTIKGDGSLTATGRDYAAGIGSGEKGSCGNIVIEGGNITATGGSNAAGIGSGYDSSSAPSSCGDITIARTVTSVTATKGNNAIHSIGKGFNYGTCGTVTIGGVPGPISESPYTYTPSGSMTSTVHFEANNGTSETMDDWLFTYDGASHTIPPCTFTTPEDMLFTGWNTAADGSGTYYENGQRIIDIPDGTLYAVWRPFIEEITTNTGALKMYDGQTLTGSGGHDTHITIEDGATVTLSGVDITHIANSHQWAGISCEGDVIIILKGENAVKGGYYSAGITVPEGHTLTIKGDGSLTATGQLYAAGIGSGKEGTCGNIVIEEGTITATGGRNAAGIGSGKGTESTQSSCGDITINGGAVIATGYEENMSIGSGQYGTCGTITINGSLIDKTIEKTRYLTVPEWIGTTSVTLSKEGYGTYYNGLLDLVLPAGIKAHIVTARGDGQTLAYETIADGNTSSNTVPAKTGVMLQATAADNVQTVDIGIMVPTVDAISQTNLLDGSDEVKGIPSANNGTKYYKLTYNQSGENLGWYWGKKDGSVFLNAAHKAWLALPPTAGAREFFGLPENYDSADGIENVNVNDNVNDNAIYNLAGQKLSRPQKGINIVNGRKVLF